MSMPPAEAGSIALYSRRWARASWCAEAGTAASVARRNLAVTANQPSTHSTCEEGLSMGETHRVEIEFDENCFGLARSEAERLGVEVEQIVQRAAPPG